jgi:two-component system, cell cycle sensor histidine kinase and response regulator CckA
MDNQIKYSEIDPEPAHRRGTRRFFRKRRSRQPSPCRTDRDRRTSEEEVEGLRAALRRLDGIVEGSHLGTWAWNVQTGETDFNGRWAQLLGYTLEELAPVSIRTWERLCHPADLRLSNELLERHFAGELPHYECECRMRHKDGHWIWVRDRGRVLTRTPEGRPLMMFGSHLEETGRRRQAAQFHRLQKMENLGMLAGSVAHDMDRLLGSILDLASAHADVQPAEGAARRAFETIVQACGLGRDQLQVLLSFAQQDRPGEQTELDLNALLRGCAESLARTPSAARIQTVLDLAPDLQSIGGDASALSGLFAELFSNAAEAMPGPGTLSLRSRNVCPGWIEVQVEDTGSGMTEDVLAKAMDPHFTSKEHGTGMGLAAAYRTIQSHHGQVEFESEPGRGTLVRLRFPACEPGVQAPPARPEPQATRARTRLRCLLVEDDPLYQRIIGRYLKFLGHTADTVWNGGEALAKLEAGCEPDVVILDLNLTGPVGARTLARLRTLRPALPVLIATGRVDESIGALVGAHPQVALIPIPFLLQDLQHYLEQLKPVD